MTSTQFSKDRRETNKKPWSFLPTTYSPPEEYFTDGDDTSTPTTRTHWGYILELNTVSLYSSSLRP